MKELGLKIRLDGNTVADRKEIYLLLNHYMSYPSTQLAETHRQANKLGVLDVDKEERYQRISSQVHLKILRTGTKRSNSTEFVSAAGFFCRRRSLVFASTVFKK